MITEKMDAKEYFVNNFVPPAAMEIVVDMRTQLLSQLWASSFIKARESGDTRDFNCNSESTPVEIENTYKCKKMFINANKCI